jgi:predicted MFS family arabinose efflux permease
MLRLPAVAVGLAVLAGLCPPPVGPVMRALWGRLTPDQASLQRALSLDTAAESTAFAFGPVLAGLLIKVLGAPVVLVACAALVLAGCALLSRAAAADARAGTPVAGGTAAGARGSLGGTGLTGLIAVTWAIAAAFSGAEIAVVAAWGTVTVGVLLALFPVGGVLGGLAYGRRDWRAPLAGRPRMLAAASAACYALPALAFWPVASGASMLLAGACADILLITTYQLVDAGVPPARRAEAGAWLNSAYNLGSAMGAAAGGTLVDQAGPRAAYAVAAGLVTLGAVTTLAGRRRSPADPVKAIFSRPEQRLFSVEVLSFPRRRRAKADNAAGAAEVGVGEHPAQRHLARALGGLEEDVQARVSRVDGDELAFAVGVHAPVMMLHERGERPGRSHQAQPVTVQAVPGVREGEKGTPLAQHPGDGADLEHVHRERRNADAAPGPGAV